jgi:hypothetical protein
MKSLHCLDKANDKDDEQLEFDKEEELEEEDVDDIDNVEGDGNDEERMGINYKRDIVCKNNDYNGAKEEEEDNDGEENDFLVNEDECIL